jgi:hypothetical protein
MDGEVEPVNDQDITRLLQSWGNGNRDALDELMPVVYSELRKLAARTLNARIIRCARRRW